jgi:hypothetical protein
MVETNGAFEAEFRGPIRETGGGDMIAEDIAGPRKAARLGRDLEFRFKHVLVAVVARTQHHPVLAENDRPFIVVGRDVPDGENQGKPLNDPREHTSSVPGTGAPRSLHRKAGHWAEVGLGFRSPRRGE